MSREVILMGRPHTCPYCGQIGESVSKGVRKTKAMGDRRIRFCKACRRKFTPKNQRAVELPHQEAGTGVESASQAPVSADAPAEAGTPKEPEEALAQLLPPPDQEWTS